MRRAKILTLVVVLLLAAGPALAKKNPKTIDGAPVLEWSLPLLAVGYLAAGLAGIAVVGFKNSKRSHLD